MVIRNDIEDFPFSDRGKVTWYFLVNWNDRRIKDFYNVSVKKELVLKLDKISKKNKIEDYVLFGVWQGQWSTDIFKIPIKKGFEKLSKHFS